MKNSLGQLWQDQTARLGLKVLLILFIFDVVFLIFNFSQLPPQIPLFYSRPWGEGQLAKPEELLILPLGALAIALLNMGMTVFLFKRFPLLAQILIWSTVFVFLLMTIGLYKIITLIS